MKKTILNSIFVFTGVCIGTLSFFALKIAYDEPNKLLIENCEDLKAIPLNTKGYYQLKNDIILDDDWQPICDFDNPFLGTFFGNGHTISFQNKSYKNEQNENIGFFMCNKGTIIRTRFTDIETNFQNDGNIVFGSISAFNYGKITSCVVDNSRLWFDCNTITMGSICGVNEGQIKNCYSYVQIKTVSNYGNIGGLIGNMSNGIVELCSKKFGSYIDTFTRENETNDLSIGGLIGYISGGEVINCSISSISNSVKDMAISNCEIGGLVGTAEPDLEILLKNLYVTGSSYVKCSTYSNECFLGGLIGKAKNSNDKILIQNCVIKSISTFYTDDMKGTHDGFVLGNTDDSLINMANLYILEGSELNSANRNTSNFTLSNYSNLSLNKLKWSANYWEVNKNGIEFLQGNVI